MARHSDRLIRRMPTMPWSLPLHYPTLVGQKEHELAKTDVVSYSNTNSKT